MFGFFCSPHHFWRCIVRASLLPAQAHVRSDGHHGRKGAAVAITSISHTVASIENVQIDIEQTEIEIDIEQNEHVQYTEASMFTSQCDIINQPLIRKPRIGL